MSEQEYLCTHCWEVTEAETAPEMCGHCKVGACRDCRTRLKHHATFCYGCGKIPPTVRATMTRGSSTGSVYSQEAWSKLHLGRTCEFIYYTTTGWDSVAQMNSGAPIQHRLQRRPKDGSYNDSQVVRTLTLDELAVLNSAPLSAREGEEAE